MKKIFIITFLLSFFYAELCFAQLRRQRKANERVRQEAAAENRINTPTQETVVLSSALQQDAQRTVVEVKGVGVRREDALQDALRNAVGQAVGVSVRSESTVENFVLLKDAISTRTEGYIADYTVIHEVPFPDRYEISIRATVSLSPLEADMQLLTQAIGGVRFLVLYDPRKIGSENEGMYDFATERINEYMAQRNYRYIDRRRFESLKREAIGIYQDSETNEETYVQRIGMMADAQFLIYISKIYVSSRSEAFDTRSSSKVTIEVRAYDNCTAEGLGTVVLESDWISSRDLQSAINDGIKEAVEQNFDRLLSLFNSYIASWVSNGTPFELRFYSVGSFRDFRDLRNKMLNDAQFGGHLEILSFNNYTKLNLTFRDRPDELAYKILDFADAIPEFKSKELDVKLIYGRQINFAPRHIKVPELEIMH